MFFGKDDNSDKEIAEMIINVVSGIRKNEDGPYNEVVERYNIVLSKMEKVQEKKFNDGDDNNGHINKVDLDQFKKKKKKEKVEVPIETEFMQKVDDFESENSDEEWTSV